MRSEKEIVRVDGARDNTPIAPLPDLNDAGDDVGTDDPTEEVDVHPIVYNDPGIDDIDRDGIDPIGDLDE